MTSSLVGSEMCIRDRGRGFPPAETRRLFEVWIVGVAVKVGTWGPDASGPVSYTHLTLPTICSV
eukprot:3580389-Prorocentrum_lima.AAC.1